VKPLGVILAGVADQGVEEAADLLARAALADGLEARRALSRAVSRTAGSVLCQVRFGRGEVASPLIPDGAADLLLALDRLEALRRVHEVRREGFVAVADHTAATPAIRAGLEEPPTGVLERLRAHVPRSVEVAAADLVHQLGMPHLVGVVLLGLAGPLLGIGDEAWEQALREQCTPDQLPAWRLALATGRSLHDGLPDHLRRPPEPQAA
jgi:indolepyruvate ferredoxin oxidoreductase beta subunit